jgi:hypothetical protein
MTKEGEKSEQPNSWNPDDDGIHQSQEVNNEGNK